MLSAVDLYAEIKRKARVNNYYILPCKLSAEQQKDEQGYAMIRLRQVLTNLGNGHQSSAVLALGRGRFQGCRKFGH
jgi:hypothetical protein